MNGVILGKKSPKKRNGDEHILSLVNVVFLLLIFFMMVGHFRAAEPFHITPGHSISITPTDPDTAIIYLNHEGKLAFQQQTITKTELGPLVAAYLAANPDAQIRLKADANLAARDMLTMLIELRKAGVTTISVITQFRPE